MAFVMPKVAMAQANVTDVGSAVQRLRYRLAIQTGSTGDVWEGDGSAVCPGNVPGGADNIYNFNQDGIAVYYDAHRLGRASTTVFMNHIAGGGNMLFMDGHVQFEPYPGRHPYTRVWAEL